MSDNEKLLQRAAYLLDGLLDGCYCSAPEMNDLVSGLVEALSEMTTDRDRWHAMWRAVLSDFQLAREGRW